MDHPMPPDFRRTVAFVIALNLVYFCIQIWLALAIGSVSLFADSTDYLEDAAINLLILIGIKWPPHRRALLGKLMAAIIVLPSLATLGMAWSKFNDLVEPQPLILTLAGLAALTVNVICAFLLVSYRNEGGSLTKAAFLSARNDALANVAIIVGGGLTAFTRSAWPDLLIGLVIAGLNAGAAHEVYEAASAEAAA